ncbi:MAG: hypothetical protein GKR87_09670 [Kiritimatiellae bacterium]|nr:hypothetical protein [Kiritimatiellia bacterium]
MGTNYFSILAQDVAGNKNERNIKVIRRLAEYLHHEHRLTMGLIPGSYTSNLYNETRQQFKSELLVEPMRFQIRPLNQNPEYWVDLKFNVDHPPGITIRADVSDTESETLVV